MYKLDIAVVGDLDENCYILSIDDATYIIDPGDEVEKILKYVKNDNVNILVTHHHFDHVGALEFLENKYKVKHNEFKDPNYSVIKTPGHSKDSLTFYFEKLNIMFCGDFIFNGTIGRMDLSGGSPFEMKESLKMIFEYDDNIVLYPGHGPKTTIGNEKRHFRF